MKALKNLSQSLLSTLKCARKTRPSPIPTLLGVAITLTLVFAYSQTGNQIIRADLTPEAQIIVLKLQSFEKETIEEANTKITAAKTAALQEAHVKIGPVRQQAIQLLEAELRKETAAQNLENALAIKKEIDRLKAGFEVTEAGVVNKIETPTTMENTATASVTPTNTPSQNGLAEARPAVQKEGQELLQAIQGKWKGKYPHSPPIEIKGDKLTISWKTGGPREHEITTKNGELVIEKGWKFQDITQNEMTLIQPNGKKMPYSRD